MSGVGCSGFADTLAKKQMGNGSHAIASVAPGHCSK